MSNFLLNLANRSMGQSTTAQGNLSRGNAPQGSAGSPGQGQPTMPQARPYLMPLFMPPAVLVAPTYVPPMPPAPTDFAPSPYPPQSPLRADAQTGESVIGEANIAGARAAMPAPPVDTSDDFVRTLRPSPPSLHPEARQTPAPPLPPLPRPPAQTPTPNMPTRADASTPPEGEIQIERIVESRQSVVMAQPAPPSLPMSPGSVDQSSEGTRPSAPQPQPTIREIILPRIQPAPAEPYLPPTSEATEPSQTPVRQNVAPTPLTPGGDSAPRRAMPAPTENQSAPAQPAPQQPPAIALPTRDTAPLRAYEIVSPTVKMEPSPILSPRQESTPAVPQIIQQSPAPFLAHERVQPAVAHVRQPPAVRHEAATPTIDVQIGVIDLHLAPPAAAQPASYASPRRARGFDAFRRLRSSGGWEA